MKCAATFALSSALLMACPLLAEPPETRPAAEQRKQLENVNSQENRELQAKNPTKWFSDLRAKYARQKAARDEAVAAAATFRENVRTESGLTDIAGLSPLVRDLQSQRETLLQEEAAAKGRRAGLENAIARATKQGDARAADDPVVVELQAVVKARQVKLDRVNHLHLAVAAPQADVDEAQAELAVARANAAAAQQRVTTGSSDAVDSWNRDLMNLNIAELERAARMDYINARLHQLLTAIKDEERAERAANLATGLQQDLNSTSFELKRYAPNDPILDESSK